MLEALVAAMIDPGREVEFHQFCGTLGERAHRWLPTSVPRGNVLGLTVDIDEGVFEANAIAFRSRLAAAGLLTHYSDATSLVHGEAR